MACTGQSASQYVESVRRHLVRGLKSLSVILENLFQQEVLCEEEVSKIQAEKDDFDKRRRIVDKVLKKGEGACYEFLRIIDKTRKRTLERPYPDTNGFDLHYWISCYPFREETKMDKKYQQGPEQCHNFQNRLKSKAQKLYQKFWMSKKNLCRPNLSYSPLVLDTQGIPCPSKIKKLKTKKSKMSRPKKLRTYVPEETVRISPSDLMKTNKPVLLVGKPGIGKTAVVLEMLRLWTERDDADLDYMIYFDMREDSHFKTAMKLQDLLFSEFSQSDEDRDEVLRDIMKNSENVTMIFDEVTDLHSSSVVQKLVEKDLLPDAKIIVTCRPDNEGDIVDDLPEDFFFRVEVKGFSEQTIRTYLSENLGEEHKQVLNNLELFTLCHVPMYALMVAVCFSSETQPCTITDLYINIVRFCLQKNSKTTKRLLNSFIKKEGEKILALAEAAFDATERKSVILTGLGSEDTCVCPFLKTLDVEVAPTDTETTSIFLHYTMQEFFAALWLLKNPGKIKDVLQQCFAEEKKHMKHLIPFMCRLLSEKAPRLMEYLIPADELKKTSKLFFEELNTTLIPHELNQQSETEDSAVDVDMVFLCQCLYESQSPETCLLFLDKLDFCLDLSGHCLDPFSCCAVSYVVTQSKEKKVKLNLEDVTISEEGVRRLHGCLKNVHWCSPLPCQLWKSLLFCVEQTDHNSSRGLNGNQLHLPVNNKSVADCDTLVTVLWRDANDCFYWDKTTPANQSLYKVLSKVLPNINSLSFVTQTSDASEETKLLGNLFCTAAEGEKLLQLLSSVCTYHGYPLTEKWMDFQLDLYSYEPEVALKVLPALQSVLQSVPTVWSINLSERKASILLEVLKLQSEKKTVNVTGWSHEESEVRSFLQCLPYISQLRSYVSDDVKFFGNLFCAAAERDQQTGEKNLQILSSLCTYPTFPFNEDDEDLYPCQSDFLLDLYCHVKDYDSTTGMSVLPALQSVLQSVPTVWIIDLSERKASILLEVLKLQSEKKQVKVTGWSHEESEVRSFLPCLPYISQLRSNFYDDVKFFGNLFCAAAERDQQTGEKNLQIFSSLCTYPTFPFNEDDVDLYPCQSDFLLDLYCHVKDYDSTTGMSVLPALQSVLQSVPTVWIIDLSKRKASILLEVLKLQSEKKQVKVTGWSHEESEVRSFLQCLPYISQLRSNFYDDVKFCGNLFCAAAERDQQTGEKNLQILSSLCTYPTFPFDEDDEDLYPYQCDFLLDLCCHVKDYDSTTGMSVLPALQSVLQSVPTVWIIDLSKRKASILLEVLKLQSEKKQVKVTGWSHEESEVRSFLQCLPYISQLRSNFYDDVKFFGNLFCAAAERDQQTGEKNLQIFSSLCTYPTFPFNEDDVDLYPCQSDFLLDLYCHVKDYDSTTGMSVLPALQSVLQSVPTVWIIDLSKRKASILLEVLKLQSEKKQVEVTGWSHEESEVRSFLQCLPYISQLRSNFYNDIKFCGNLFCAAAERDQQTGEKNLQILSSLCTYPTFPFDEDDEDLYPYQCDFLLDLCCHVKDYDSTTGMSVLPALQSVLQSVPTVWTIDLSKRKASILLEVLKLQSEKKQVEVTGWSHEESEVRSFLPCLPYISQLSCYPAFFQEVCSSISIRSREETQQLASLLKLQGFSLLLEGELNQKTCCTVGRVLRFCGHKVDLILTPTKISTRGASVLFKHTSQLHSLRLSDSLASLLFRWMKRKRVVCTFAVPELHLVSKTNKRSEPALLKVVSRVSCLLRYWTVRCLDLTEFCVPALSLITLLLHDASLKIKLNKDNYQQLVTLLYEIQDKDLSCSFVSKCGGDLSACCLNWELLHYLLQQSRHTFTMNVRKNTFLQENITHLLPFLDSIQFLRPSPSFVLAAIREIDKAQVRHIIPGFLKSLDHMLTLTCRKLDSADFAALLFTLKHSDKVKVNLLWTSIPTEGTESLLFTLDRVSQLSVDRYLLLRLVHCCAASNVHQRAASGLLQSLQHRLDLSSSSCVALSDRDEREVLSLTADDCRAISIILRHISEDTQLDLRDCEVEDSGLDLLLPVPDRVHLRASKAVVLSLLSLVPVNSERDTVRRTESLWKALRGELDLSHTMLDQRTCGALALMLDLSEGLTELDLSHCQLTDQLLLMLSAHLHKVQVLDLSHNQITDASTDVFLQLCSVNTSTQTVRLFSNNIVDRTPFNEDKRFEMW
ncbi:uncharacterized protein LOC115415582 isoform X2 [Sphaeramia orbicularis]|uniref:Uncharacterized LOC115415582 n=1 Tax=Sphaeramia orbicularis TaxID=375764 RepID=A0A672Z017_9TELE|nr:uncharacterized protein LOC115415582 isoform X2 [Sphaeramia orbicularis]